LLPQPKTSPASERANECYPPQAIFYIFGKFSTFFGFFTRLDTNAPWFITAS